MLEAEAATRSPDDSNPSNRELLLEMRESLNKLLNQTTASARVGAAIDMLEDLYIDPLTRLPNVRSLMTEAARLDANGVSYVLAMIDLNEFKRINDVFGHHTGDRVLAFVASRLKDHIPSAGMVARYGGDEFVVMSGDTSPTKLAETLTDVFPIMSESAGQAGLPDFTLTAGVSTDRLESVEEKLRDADRAMYEAKRVAATL